jgi:glycosyltransferase involved in cell wall biosynthesis
MTNPDKPHSPLFSIVTVCLNPGDDLAPTVDSVLNQAFDDYELLIKDGGSEDGTQTIQWDDPRIRVESSTDGGIYSAMNRALELCDGNYVLFLNAGDTFASSDVLSQVAEFCASSDAPDIVYGDVYNKRFKTIMRYPDRLTPGFLYRKTLCHQVTFVRRSCIVSIGGFSDMRYRILADYDLLCRLVLQCGASSKHVPCVAVCYKDGGLSASSKMAHLKRRETNMIRTTYFSLVQRIVRGALWHATLPSVRIWLIQNCRHPLFRRSYAAIANWLVSSRLESAEAVKRHVKGPQRRP